MRFAFGFVDNCEHLRFVDNPNRPRHAVKRIALLLSLLILVAAPARAEDPVVAEEFGFEFVSENVGEWGRSHHVYSGVIQTEGTACTISFTNIVRQLTRKEGLPPHEGDSLKPFSFRIDFSSAFEEMEVSLTSGGTGAFEKDEMAYVLGLAVCENVVRPFLGTNFLAKSPYADNDATKVLRMRPSLIRFKGIGEVPGKDIREYLVGIREMVAIPGELRIGEENTIHLFGSSLAKGRYQFVSQKIRSHEKLPFETILFSAYLKDGNIRTEEVLKHTFSEDRGSFFDSFNSATIRLTPPHFIQHSALTSAPATPGPAGEEPHAEAAE